MKLHTSEYPLTVKSALTHVMANQATTYVKKVTGHRGFLFKYNCFCPKMYMNCRYVSMYNMYVSSVCFHLEYLFYLQGHINYNITNSYDVVTRRRQISTGLHNIWKTDFKYVHLCCDLFKDEHFEYGCHTCHIVSTCTCMNLMSLHIHFP